MTIDDLIAQLEACKNAQKLSGSTPVLIYHTGGARSVRAVSGKARAFRKKATDGSGADVILERFYPPIVEGDKLIGGELVEVVVIAPTADRPPVRIVPGGAPTPEAR